MAEVGGALLVQKGEQPLGDALETSCISGRDGVPKLGLSVMQIIDGVEVHVLSVPSESRLPHSEVQVSCVHPADLHVVIFVDPVQDGA